MIQNRFLLVVILLAIEVVVLFLASHQRFKKYFEFLPGVFWIYFFPMLMSTFGLVDAKSSIYQSISNIFLPASLLLLLIPVDIKAILKLGPTALLMFFAGSLGIVLGAPVVFWLLKRWIGVDFWSGFACLSGSWTGGSANMIAVKEALQTPDAVFLPMVVVDTVVPYVWMGSLIALKGMQAVYDRWNKTDRKILDDLAGQISKIDLKKSDRRQLVPVVLVLALGLLGSVLSSKLAKFLPVIKDVVSPYAWTIIVVSVLGIVLSLTRMRKIESFGASRVGYFLLYFVLTSIGAKASLTNIQSTFILIFAGVLLVLIHACVLIATAKLIKAPLFLVATASQANIGGVASAPVVAEIYQPGFAAVGLLLAILGNIVGTWIGIAVGQICRLLQ